METGSKVYVAGGSKVIGAGILRSLDKRAKFNIVGRGANEPDWTHKDDLNRFFKLERPDYVFIAGGKSGGIQLNCTKPATLMLDNLLMACNIIPLAHTYKVKKLLNIASSCCYPKENHQPIDEDSLMAGKLEPTNEGYAMAKLVGITMCKAYNVEYGTSFISAVPSNYFGSGDDFSLENSHVIGALIRRFYEAKQNNDTSVTIWGTGKPTREFIYVDDLAEACLFVMEKYTKIEPVNIGVGGNISIAKLAEMISKIVGYQGNIEFDPSKPDGMMRKELDSAKLKKMGWNSSISLEQGLSETFQWFLNNYIKESIGVNI